MNWEKLVGNMKCPEEHSVILVVIFPIFVNWNEYLKKRDLLTLYIIAPRNLADGTASIFTNKYGAQMPSAQKTSSGYKRNFVLNSCIFQRLKFTVIFPVL